MHAQLSSLSACAWGRRPGAGA